MDHNTAKLFGLLGLVGIYIIIKILAKIFGHKIMHIFFGILIYSLISILIYFLSENSEYHLIIISILLILFFPFIFWSKNEGIKSQMRSDFDVPHEDVIKQRENLIKLLHGESPSISFELIKKISEKEHPSFKNIDNGFSIEYHENYFEFTLSDKNYSIKKENIEARLKRIRQKEEMKRREIEEEKFAKKEAIRKAKENRKYALQNSPLTNYFNAKEGGETILYYLKLKNKFGKTRYKVGVTLNNVQKRYSNQYKYEILYEKKLTHANTIEKNILKEFSHLITDESLLGTNGTEIFNEDILRLDV